MTGRRRAVFLDRDGTLIHDAHYARDGDALVLLPRAAAAVRRVNESGVLAVVITNQSGIDQGLISPAQYESTRRRLEELLAAEGARIDATYHCPHHPDVFGPCDCRKPGTALFLRAARDLDIDLTNSLYVGDRFRDIEPGLTLGGRSVLVPSAETAEEDRVRAELEAELVTTLGEAVEGFLGASQGMER